MMDRYSLRDVHFPSCKEELGFETNLTDSEIRAVRAEYLEYAYHAMARFSRGSVLIQQGKVVTREMIETVLVRDGW